MKVKAEYSVCEDCFFAIANDDYTNLYHYYTNDETEKRMKAIKKGIGSLGPHLVPGNKGYGFCKTPCDYYGYHLHGCRYQIIQLGD